MALRPTEAGSPGDSEAGRNRSLATASRLTKPTGLFRGTGRELGQRVATAAPEASRNARTVRGLRNSGSSTTISDSAKKLLSNGDFAKDFARSAKEINTGRGLTRAQRKARTKAAKTRLAVEGGNLTGDAAEQALDLSRASLERGLTSSQRTGLSDASSQLLEGAVDANTEGDDASAFEESLLKFFDI